MNKKTKRGKHQTFPDQEIIKILTSNPSKSYSFQALLNLLPKKFTPELIDQSIQLLKKQNKITYLDGKWSLRKDINTADLHPNEIIGKVDIARSGAVFVVSEDSERDVFVSNKIVPGVLHGDKVLVHLSFKKTGARPEGKIVKIIERANTLFMGTIEVTPNFSFVKVESSWLKQDIYISLRKLNKAKNGDTVIVKITKWESTDKNPAGEVMEVLGKMSPNDLIMNSILVGNGFQMGFPEEVEKEVKQIAENISAAEIKTRLDCRAIPTFTIDPDDAKDFDDAISVEDKGEGNWRIGVHIADVSHYVKPNTALDREAIQRATSVYLPDRVCPMLPEKLSNHVCSLRPNEDKLCFSVLFDFNANNKITNYTIAKTIIHSKRRFTYNEAQQVIETGEGDCAKEIVKIAELARMMRKERFEQGAIAFESTEVRFKLDADAKPIEVVIKERKEANLMIEDWMLLANKTVALYMAKLKVGENPIPFVYRIHDTPNPTKLETFRSVAQRFGYQLKKFDDPKDTAETLNRLMEKVQGKPEQNILEQLAIRCMAKAVYTTDNIGHYGLGFHYYSHFTSPIRRYPDVLAHRLIFEQLQGHTPPMDKGDLESLCKKSSEMERGASDCERQATKYKQVEYLSERIGETYEGIISGMIQRGFWVELKDNKCEGFVDIQEIMPGEEIFFDEERMELAGNKSKLVFRIGESVKIKVAATDLIERKVWFEFVEKL